MNTQVGTTSRGPEATSLAPDTSNGALLVGENNAYLAPDDTLASMLRPLAADSGEVVAYCRTGPRASLGFLALSKLGYTPKLYDGSITDWLRHNGPLETS